MCVFHPEGPKWKWRVRAKTWRSLNVLFSIWMISLSWHILLNVCVFSIPAWEISHSTHQFLPLHPNRVIVLLLKGEHAEPSPRAPSPAYPIGPLHGLLEALIIQLIWFHVLYRPTLPSMHEQMLPLLLISFPSEGATVERLHRAVAALRELSSKASRGNASVPATYSRMLGRTSGRTVMWLAYITSRPSTRRKSRTWRWTTWRKGSLNESKHCEFASDRRESAEESGVILNEREGQRRGPGRIKQWREAQWEERNVNKVSMEGRICRSRAEPGLKMKHNERISPEAQIEHFPFQCHQSRKWHVLLLLSLQFLLPTSVSFISKDMLSVRGRPRCQLFFIIRHQRCRLTPVSIRRLWDELIWDRD